MKPYQLNLKLAGYFQHHVSAKINLSPVPTTSKEVDHIYRNLKRLGNIEYFVMQRDKTRFNLYGSKLHVVFNPCNTQSLIASQFKSFSSVETSMDTPASRERWKEILQNKNDLITNLNRIIALPRFSYVAGDKDYWKGKVKVSFNYKLSKEGLKYDKKFTLCPSIVPDEFISVSDTEIDTEELKDFRRKIRHNFQKFHKFESLEIKEGLDPINEIIGYRKLIDPSDEEGISQENRPNDTMNLKLNVITKGFNGFLN